MHLLTVFWCSDDDRMEWLSSISAYDLDILSLEFGKKCKQALFELEFLCNFLHYHEM